MSLPGLQIGGISLLIHVIVNFVAKIFQKLPRPIRLGAKSQIGSNPKGGIG